MLLLRNIIKSAAHTSQIKKTAICMNYVVQQQQRRQPLWGYVALAFNKVDTDRRSKVGPNRLCAEWVIKNGGAVRLLEIPTKLMRDYNSLPPESFKFHIKEVDATDASIMKIGLDHFDGCQQIDTVIFANCNHLENDGLDGLLHLKGTLTKLQVSGCSNMVADSLKVIAKLTNLRQLRIFDMLYIRDLKEVCAELQRDLPNCEIKTTKI